MIILHYTNQVNKSANEDSINKIYNHLRKCENLVGKQWDMGLWVIIVFSRVSRRKLNLKAMRETDENTRWEWDSDLIQIKEKIQKDGLVKGWKKKRSNIWSPFEEFAQGPFVCFEFLDSILFSPLFYFSVSFSESFICCFLS